MAIFNTLDDYFKLDETVAITLLSKYMRRLHSLHLPYDILEQLKTNVLSLPARLQKHPVVKEINHYLDPLLHATIGFPTTDLTSISGVNEPFSLQNYLSRFVILYIYPPLEGYRKLPKNDWSPKFVDFLKDHDIQRICIDLRIDYLDKELHAQCDETFYVRDREDQDIFKRFYGLNNRSKVILISPLGNILADDIDDPEEIIKVVSEYWNGMNF